MGTLRKVFSLAEPDQPIELWIVAMVELLHGGAWGIRVLVKTTTAKECGLVSRHIPRGCNNDNPVVIINVFCKKRSPYFTMSKKEFINYYGDIPLMPDTDMFLKRYKEFIIEYNKSLDKTLQSLDELKKRLNKVVADIEDLVEPAQ
ncbi:MAG TPA: hypothetical protein PLI45_02390 [Candidatus Woesebacteria bacterium]|nr:hypothetical protein [Candidatus Woesebacteria bacterium]